MCALVAVQWFPVRLLLDIRVLTSAPSALLLPQSVALLTPLQHVPKTGRCIPKFARIFGH